MANISGQISGTTRGPREVQETYLVMACKLGEVHRYERRTTEAAATTRRRLGALGYAVTVLRPGSWAK